MSGRGHNDLLPTALVTENGQGLSHEKAECLPILFLAVQEFLTGRAEEGIFLRTWDIVPCAAIGKNDERCVACSGGNFYDRLPGWK